MADGPILVTGAAGFIGFHVARRLLRDGHDVIGLDSMNTYYDPVLKEARRAELAKSSRFRFVKLDLADRGGMANLFKEFRFPYVIHLACRDYFFPELGIRDHKLQGEILPKSSPN